MDVNDFLRLSALVKLTNTEPFAGARGAVRLTPLDGSQPTAEAHAKVYLDSWLTNSLATS